jgi:hypothetical protein
VVVCSYFRPNYRYAFGSGTCLMSAFHAYLSHVSVDNAVRNHRSKRCGCDESDAKGPFGRAPSSGFSTRIRGALPNRCFPEWILARITDSDSSFYERIGESKKTGSSRGLNRFSTNQGWTSPPSSGEFTRKCHWTKLPCPPFSPLTDTLPGSTQNPSSSHAQDMELPA